MQASENLIAFLKKKEAFSEKAYPDTNGIWTIGWGTIRWNTKTPVKEGDTITKEEAERLLRVEVQRVVDALNDTIKVPLTQNEFDALTSWGYNVGTGWITGYKHDQATLIKLLNQGKYDQVPGQLLLFRKGTNGKVVEGLINRRKEEVQLWLSDAPEVIVAAAKEVPLGEMPQAVKPEKAKVTTAVKSSWTVWGALSGLAAYISTGLDNVFHWSTTTAQQVLDTQTDIGPVQSLFGTLVGHANMAGTALLGFALVMIIFRQINAAREGKVG